MSKTETLIAEKRKNYDNIGDEKKTILYESDQ